MCAVDALHAIDGSPNVPDWRGFSVAAVIAPGQKIACIDHHQDTTMAHRKANFYLDPEFKREFLAANGAVLSNQDPEVQKGAFISKHGVAAGKAAVLDNQISLDVAYEIAQLPKEQQAARRTTHLTNDAGKFKAAHEREIMLRVKAVFQGKSSIELVGAKRGELTAPLSVAIPLSVEDVADLQRLRMEVGIATDADYIIEALRMMRLAIALGRIGCVVQARHPWLQEPVDFAVPLDRHDSVRPIKPYGDLSDG